MKKSLSLLVGGILLTMPLVSLAQINSALSYGSHGAQVTELQEFLISLGDLTGQATGNFYSLTLAAVKEYQSANNIPSTGYVGTLTRTAINTSLSSELASSTSEEEEETGTTTPPITDSSSKVEQVLQQQNQLLQQQLQAQQQTNQLLQNQTVQTQVAASVAPIISIPTCTLTGNFDQLAGNQSGDLQWTSTNATTMDLKSVFFNDNEVQPGFDYPAGNSNITMTDIPNGQLLSAALSFGTDEPKSTATTTFTASFSNQTGTTTCNYTFPTHSYVTGQ